MLTLLLTFLIYLHILVSQFYFDFKQTLIKDMTWESVFRIRITSGWKISAIHGTYTVKSSDLLSYPVDEYLFIYTSYIKFQPIYYIVRKHLCMNLNQRKI